MNKFSTSLGSGAGFGAESRPVLPGKTPGGLPSMVNPYNIVSLSSSLDSSKNEKPNTESKSMKKEKQQNPMKNQQDLLIKKVLSKLPFDLQSSVSSILSMNQMLSESAERTAACQAIELLSLRAEVRKKTLQIEQLQKGQEIYRDRISIYEEKIKSLEDSINLQQKFSHQNKRAVTIMSNTNKMLIGSLEALKGESLVLNTDSTSEVDIAETLEHKSPNSNAKPRGEDSRNKSNKGVPGVAAASDQNIEGDKLRESLMRVSRDYYKYVKRCETLEKKVYELREEQEKSIQKIRDLKQELEEYRDGSVLVEKDNALDKPIPIDSLENPTKGMKAYLLNLEERFLSLLRKNALDPLETLLNLKHILQINTNTPSNLVESDIAHHFISKEICHLFGVEAINMYILQSEDLMIKYSSNAEPRPYIVGPDSVASIAQTVLKSGELMRVNIISKNHTFNQEIDGSANVASHNRLMSIPLKAQDGSRAVGVFQLLNKSKSFTETDEIFVISLTGVIGPLISSSIMFKRLSNRAELANSLLNASTAIYSVIPDPASISSKRPLRLEDILNNIEIVARNAIKCSKCKAFILSDIIQNEDIGYLLSLETSSGGAVDKSIKDSSTTRKTPIHSGIAGYTITNKRMYIMDDINIDSKFNPEVDIDPFGWTLVVAPIIDLNGNVMACVEFAASSFSPQLRRGQDGGDGRILLDEAVLWLTYQLAAPLHHILSFLDRPASRPVSTPGRLSPRFKKGQSFPSINTSDLSEFDSKYVSPMALSLKKGVSFQEDPCFSVDIEQYQDMKLKLDHSILEISSLRENMKMEADKIVLERDELKRLNELVITLEKASVEYKRTINNNENAFYVEKSEYIQKIESLETEIKLKGADNNEKDTFLQEIINSNKLLENQKKEMEYKLLETENEISRLNDSSKIALNNLQNESQKKLNQANQEISVLQNELASAKNLIEMYSKDKESLAGDKNEKEKVLADELAFVRNNFTTLEISNSQLISKLKEMESIVSNKESVIKIMQDQLVKMADESMEGLDNAMGLNRVSESDNTWQECQDEHGNLYYYNSKTNESSWDPPPGYTKSVDGKLRPLI